MPVKAPKDIDEQWLIFFTGFDGTQARGLGFVSWKEVSAFAGTELFRLVTGNFSDVQATMKGFELLLGDGDKAKKVADDLGLTDKWSLEGKV